MATPQTRLWTYDDYAAMEDDGKRYEIIEGELIEMLGARTRHQATAAAILALLWFYVRDRRLGQVFDAPYDVVFSPTDVVQPDVLFVSAANAGIIKELNVQGSPDLCVEVLSPGSQERDTAQKYDLYRRFGVREYWLVNPDTDTITVYALNDGVYTVLVEATGDAEVRSAVLPGFASPAAAFFPA